MTTRTVHHLHGTGTIPLVEECLDGIRDHYYKMRWMRLFGVTDSGDFVYETTPEGREKGKGPFLVFSYSKEMSQAEFAFVRHLKAVHGGRPDFGERYDAAKKVCFTAAYGSEAFAPICAEYRRGEEDAEFQLTRVWDKPAAFVVVEGLMDEMHMAAIKTMLLPATVEDEKKALPMKTMYFDSDALKAVCAKLEAGYSGLRGALPYTHDEIFAELQLVDGRTRYRAYTGLDTKIPKGLVLHTTATGRLRTDQENLSNTPKPAFSEPGSQNPCNEVPIEPYLKLKEEIIQALKDEVNGIEIPTHVIDPYNKRDIEATMEHFGEFSDEPPEPPLSDVSNRVANTPEARDRFNRVMRVVRERLDAETLCFLDDGERALTWVELSELRAVGEYQCYESGGGWIAAIEIKDHPDCPMGPRFFFAIDLMGTGATHKEANDNLVACLQYVPVVKP